jgi:6-phospho-beta-glucosidase
MLWSPHDFSQYAAAMREGAAAASWLIHDHLTGEPHAPAFMYPLYVGLGKLAGLLHLDAQAVYHGAEIAARVDQPEWLVRQLGVVPSYYLHYFYNHDAAVEAARGARSRGAQVAEMERTLLELYADPAVDTKPALLGERGGAYYSEAAINLLASLTADRGDVQVVNLRNEGTLPFLPDDAVIEVPATITRSGAEAVAVDPVPPMYSGLIAHTFAYEQLALEAALHGGRDRVFQALLAHPLVGQVEAATGLTDRLLAANRDHLGWAR